MERICTKLVPPVQPAGLLDRPRLRAQQSRIGSHRLTVVRAPAGYGKTTLLAQWFDALKSDGAIVAWLMLDAHERTAGNLIGSVAAMLARNPRVGQGLDALSRDQAGTSAEAVLATVVERLAAADAPVTLFLDDVHEIGRDAALMLAELVHRAPLNTHFVMATREAKSIGLAAMRAYGQLLEIGHAELRFTAQEAASLLAAAGHDGLDAADVEALVARTEGWVTGLKLAALGMAQEPDRKIFLAAFSGRRRAVADFFAEDVLARQSEKVRTFLLDTAILDRLTPPLCDAVTGHRGASAMLRHLEESGLFVAQLDDEGTAYRYHGLFAEFLQRRLADLDPQAAERLHRRAARWLAAQKCFVEALEHAAQANDHELLAATLEATAEEFTYTGKLRIVARYAALLPEAVLARSPWTALAVAWLKIRGLRFAEARHLLDLASRRLQQLRSEATPDQDALEALQRTIQHREMMLAAAHDELGSVEEQCTQLLRYFGPNRPYIACTLYGQLMTARREQFRFDGLERLHAQARATAEESGYRFALVGLQSVAGVSLFAAGRTEAAVAALMQGLEESQRWSGWSSSLAALVALPLADIAYERNDLAKAAEYVENHLPAARELSFVDQLVAGHIVRSRLHGVRGDLAGARRALDDAMNVALECDLERLRLVVLNEQVRLLLRNGMPEAAARQAAQADAPRTAEECAPRPCTTTRDELRATIWARMAISQDRIAEALTLAKQWRSFCAHRGAVRSLVHWNILMAQMLMIGSDARAAQRVMREAVAAAAPADLVRSFVDEGALVLTILSEAYADSMRSGHPTDVFAQRVLEAFDRKRPSPDLMAVPEDGLYGRLSGKELEILTLVGCGMRNREIGNRLGLSEGSVKWYMQQVYDKVGIRRRSQAVERARQFGLIA
jgi:LuxR family maltose regulon positive regulatory protein